MPDRDDIHKRFSSARSDARRGRDAVKDAENKLSRAELDRLLALSLKDRFDAIAQPDLPLTDAHRRELVRSLQEKRPAKSPIAAKPASRWAMWRARLRYRIASLMVVTTSIFVCGGLLFFAARYRTPGQWAASAFNYNTAATWRYPDQRLISYPIEAGTRYPLLRREGEEGVLLMWVPSLGYAETRVPLQWLRLQK